MAEIKFLTEEVATKIEDDSLGGRGGERGGREISQSRGRGQGTGDRTLFEGGA